MLPGYLLWIGIPVSVVATEYIRDIMYDRDQRNFSY